MGEGEKEIKSSEIWGALYGLLWTSDYETLVASLSLMNVLVWSGGVTILNKIKLLPLVIKLLAKKEIEFVLHIQSIIFAILEEKSAKGLRKQLVDLGTIDILIDVEKSPEFLVIPTLLSKIKWTRCELEIIASAIK